MRRYAFAVCQPINFRIVSSVFAKRQPAAETEILPTSSTVSNVIDHAAGILKNDVPAMLAGDFKVVPTDFDIYSLRSFADNALVQPEPRAAERCIPMSRCLRFRATCETDGHATLACGLTVCCWPRACAALESRRFAADLQNAYRDDLTIEGGILRDECSQLYYRPWDRVPERDQSNK